MLEFKKEFVEKSLNLTFNPMTTQIESHDYTCHILDGIRHFNNVVMDMDVDTMLDHVSTVFFKGFLFAYFCIVFVSYLFALSVDNLTKRRAGIITVMIPDCFIWILICALSLILVDARFQLNQFLAYAGWNVFLIVMLLYGIRGIGIIRQMLEARGLHPVVRMFLTLAVVVLLMHPLFGRVLLIGIPCVGISEIWFKYKRT